jgi:hypothetical protein
LSLLSLFFLKKTIYPRLFGYQKVTKSDKKCQFIDGLYALATKAGSANHYKD